MKRNLFALALAGALLLSGCNSMLERSYSSSTAHVDYSVTAEDPSILRAENYQSLVNSILYLVDKHQTEGTIRLYNYTGNVEADLSGAQAEVMEKDPLGAYVLSALDYEYTRILTYYEVKISAKYRRTLAEVNAVRPVVGQAGLRRELERITASYQSDAALRTSYFTGDAQTVRDLFRSVFYSSPAVAIAAPQVEVAFYPEAGTQRILQLEFAWPTNSIEQVQYSRDLSNAADALLEAGRSYTLDELVGLLRGILSYSPTGASTALSALNGEPVNDLGAMLALEYLCIKNDIEVSAASDTSNAQMWLIVSTPSGYRHLLPRSLRPDFENGTEPLLYTDSELSDMGFQWPAGLHPACVDYSGNIQ